MVVGVMKFGYSDVIKIITDKPPGFNTIFVNNYGFLTYVTIISY